MTKLQLIYAMRELRRLQAHLHLYREKLALLGVDPKQQVVRDMDKLLTSSAALVPLFDREAGRVRK